MSLPQRILGWLFLSVVLVAVVLGFESKFFHKASGKAEQAAHLEAQKAEVKAQEATATDAKIPILQAQLDATKQHLAQVTAHRDALLKQLADAKPLVSLPPMPSMPPTFPSVKDELLAQDAEVIQAQKLVIAQQDGQIQTLTLSRDQWKAAFSDEKRANVGLQLALDAQKAANSNSKWLYRLEGFALGVGIGYVGAKL